MRGRGDKKKEARIGPGTAEGWIERERVYCILGEKIRYAKKRGAQIGLRARKRDVCYVNLINFDKMLYHVRYNQENDIYKVLAIIFFF